MTSMCPPIDKVKTKGSQKGYAGKFEQSTKSLPSFFEHVDALHFVDDSSSTWRSPSTLSQQPARMRKIPTLDQFHVNFHPYISNIVDVRSHGHCCYQTVATSLGMGEDFWPLVHNDLHKELGKWYDEYAKKVIFTC